MFDKELEKKMKDFYNKGEKCPKCGSEDSEPVHPFDYIKLCRPCNKQFVGHIHN